MFPHNHFSPVCEFLADFVDSHTATTGSLRCYLYTTRRLQHASVSCKRSYCNKIKKLESRTSEVLSKDGKKRVSPFYHVASYMSSVVDFLVDCHELHKDSLHCHQLEEELDDWCHLWYFQNGTGLSCSSQDSWCTRFDLDNTHRWSQNDVSPVQCFQTFWEKSTNSSCIESTLLASFDRWNLSARSCPSWYRPLQCDHVRDEMHEIEDLSRNERESLQNSSQCISFSKLWATWWSLCSLAFPRRWPWGRPFSMTQFWIERRSNVHWIAPRLAPRLAALSFKRCPQVYI